MSHFPRAALLIALCLLPGCFEKKAPSVPRKASYKIDSRGTALATALDAQILAHPKQSGFMLLPDGEQDFLLRIAMIESAQKSIDLQYYSVGNDNTGKLILESLLKAADRGVRVRVLVDDLHLANAKKTLSILTHHDHIEIRVFNPFARQGESRLSRLSHIGDRLREFTRRMHNKTFIVDDIVAVAGGRNLGDAYFGFNKEYNFRDLDLLVCGSLTERLSDSFDRYWNSDESVDFEAVHPGHDDAAEMTALRAALDQHWEDEKRAGEIKKLIPLPNALQKGTLALVWAPAELAVDRPEKIEQGVGDTGSPPTARLVDLANAATHEFLLVSPYFIPGEDGVHWLQALHQKGIAVRVMTNSLASSDVTMVHSGYRRYRYPLAASGIEIYEMKPLPKPAPGSRIRGRKSRASLHAKAYIIDGKDLVLGSFNFDPRSEQRNTEMLLIVHSPVLSEAIRTRFMQATEPTRSYRIQAGPDGGITWNAGKQQLTHEPEASLWRRFMVNVYSLLPIESQL